MEITEDTRKEQITPPWVQECASRDWIDRVLLNWNFMPLSLGSSCSLLSLMDLSQLSLCLIFPGNEEFINALCPKLLFECLLIMYSHL